MELGYTGIAYNRTMKGVMSERDRCSIPLLTLSSLLKVAPSLSSSVNFHRDLLGIPRTSPFRQYTRLTVSVDSIPQCQALNSGNPVLKTYDLVAARPLNQIAFDYSCEKAEVDIVAVDFSDKMNFRLKQAMVKAAVQRGVCFEINYSDLIVDVEARRQMISNAKMLVDWTRGKNLIFSSAAPSVCELRGPNDVANLGFLLGVSNERARAAVSKNCRTLIANALKRKHFFKEAIRIEPILSKCDSEKPLSLDWLKWDPISSGDGDLVLDDTPSASKESETVKAIDFTSAVDNMPSHGFELKNLVSGANSEKFDNETLKSTPEIEEVRKGVDEEPKNQFVSDVHMEDSEFISLDSDDLPLREKTMDINLTQDPGDEKAREVIMEEQKAGEPETVSEIDSALPDKANEGSNLKADGHGAAAVSNEVSMNEIIEEEPVTAAAYEADIEPISCMIAKDEPSTAEKKTEEEEAVKTQEPGESDCKTDHPISAKVTTGKSRGRRRICHPFSPLNRILHRAMFKRRARKSRQ